MKGKWEEFKSGEQKAPEKEPETEQPRAKMSSGFNQASFEGVDELETELEHDIAFDAEDDLEL